MIFPVEKVKQFTDTMAANNIVPEFECFDTGIIRSVGMFKANGMFSGNPHLSFVMGVDSGMPARADLLPILKDELPENTNWQVIATGAGREKLWVFKDRLPDNCLATLSVGDMLQILSPPSGLAKSII